MNNLIQYLKQQVALEAEDLPTYSREYNLLLMKYGIRKPQLTGSEIQLIKREQQRGY